MSQAKNVSKRKPSKKALTVLGFAGVSLAAMTGGSDALMPSQGMAPQAVPLGEEEISDVTLATFHLYDKDAVGTKRSMLELTKCGKGGGCHGCGGRGGRCGGGRCGGGRCGGRCGGGCGGGCGWGWCLSWGGCRPWC
jgi:hypothetical protein